MQKNINTYISTRLFSGSSTLVNVKNIRKKVSGNCTPPLQKETKCSGPPGPALSSWRWVPRQRPPHLAQRPWPTELRLGHDDEPSIQGCSEDGCLLVSQSSELSVSEVSSLSPREKEVSLSQRTALKTPGHSHLPTCPSSKEYVSEDPRTDQAQWMAWTSLWCLHSLQVGGTGPVSNSSRPRADSGKPGGNPDPTPQLGVRRSMGRL